MGQKEDMEREQVIACTVGSSMLCVTKQKMAYICQRCAGWGNQRYARQRSMLTPVCRTLLHTSNEHHQMLAFPSAVFLWQNQKNRRAIITPRGIPGIERLTVWCCSLRVAPFCLGGVVLDKIVVRWWPGGVQGGIVEMAGDKLRRCLRRRGSQRRLYGATGIKGKRTARMERATWRDGAQVWWYTRDATHALHRPMQRWKRVE